MNLKDIVIRLDVAEIQRILAIDMDSDREQALEFIKEDELVEVTPQSIRVRKKILEAGKRRSARP